MLAALGSIITIVSTIVPLVFAIAKVFPRLKHFLKLVWDWSRGTLPGGRSAFWGLGVALFGFVGGFAFLVSLYNGVGLRIYLSFLDLIFTPFAWVVEGLLSGFISQLPSLPSNTASVLCLFDFSRVFTLLVIGFSSEVFMRIVIHYLVRR